MIMNNENDSANNCGPLSCDSELKARVKRKKEEKQQTEDIEWEHRKNYLRNKIDRKINNKILRRFVFWLFKER